MANENNESKRDLTVLSNGQAISDSEYVRLVSLISDTWEKAKGRAALAVNTELLDANWQTGRYGRRVDTSWSLSRAVMRRLAMESS